MDIWYNLAVYLTSLHKIEINWKLSKKQIRYNSFSRIYYSLLRLISKVTWTGEKLLIINLLTNLISFQMKYNKPRKTSSLTHLVLHKFICPNYLKNIEHVRQWSLKIVEKKRIPIVTFDWLSFYGSFIHRVGNKILAIQYDRYLICAIQKHFLLLLTLAFNYLHPPPFRLLPQFNLYSQFNSIAQISIISISPTLSKWDAKKCGNLARLI